MTLMRVITCARDMNKPETIATTVVRPPCLDIFRARSAQSGYSARHIHIYFKDILALTTLPSLFLILIQRLPPLRPPPQTV